jgi:hypothetical protein
MIILKIRKRQMSQGKAVACEETVQINRITLWLNKQQKLVEKYNKYIVQ